MNTFTLIVRGRHISSQWAVAHLQSTDSPPDGRGILNVDPLTQQVTSVGKVQKGLFAHFPLLAGN